MELFQAGAHWAGRRESAEACARRVEVLFRQLGRCDPAYSRWFEYAYSRKHSLQLPFEPTSETFLRFFERRKYRLAREVFTFEAWTGQEQQGRGGMLSFTCGSNESFYPNGCLLHLPREEPAASRVLTVSVLREVVRAMVLAWDPDGCAVIAQGDRGAKKAMEDGGTCLGWLTYVSGQRGRVPSLPRPARAEPMEDQGTLIVLTPERFSLDNPAHVALAGRVRERLEKAGLLPPPGG
ncbi:immunity protein 52 of polymorphic toxin system [Archangium gephyra]|uniref:Immunity protein 52 of polymorphic toxin system n=2 Tax=Archangium gephyra TaxID=48 RepID=A0ABX9JT82_9BACT|nr:immunity protein 52 of polymorphic toxin system [Archangium gephyra]